MPLTNPDRVVHAFIEVIDGRLICITRAAHAETDWRLYIGDHQLTQAELIGYANYYPCNRRDCENRDTVHAHRALSISTDQGQIWLAGEDNRVPSHWDDADGRHDITVLPDDFEMTEADGVLYISDSASV